MPILYGPDGRPINTSDTQSSQKKGRPQGLQSRPPLGLLWKIGGMFVTIVGLIGFAITVYELRPILSPSADNGAFSFSFAKANIANTGQLTMYKVEQSCEVNKIVFTEKHTIDPSNFNILFTQRKVPDVKSGETLPVDCVQPWHLYIWGKNNELGLLAAGDVPLPNEPKQTQFIWAFDIHPNGTIRVTHTPIPGDRVTSGTDIPVTGVDMTIRIDYELFFGCFRVTKKLRYVTQRGSNGPIWVFVPESNPPIPNGIGGLNLSLSGGPMTVELVSR